MPKKGRNKTLNQALQQRNRIVDYYENTGRKSTADRIWRGTTGVGGVVGNMADRITMRGGDYTDYRQMSKPISFEDRTTPVTDEEYNAAVNRIQKRRDYRAARKAQGLSAG